MPYLDYLEGIDGGQIFNNPTIDNIIFNQSINQIINSGQIKKCKIITGYNSDEFGLFLFAYDIANQANNYGTSGFNFSQFLYWVNKQIFYFPSYPLKPSQNFVKNLVAEYFKTTLIPFNLLSPVYINYFNQLMSDFWFVCQSFQFAEIHSNMNLDAYVYEFTYRGSKTWLPSYLGVATHADELVYTFGLPLSNKVIIHFVYIQYKKFAIRSLQGRNYIVNLFLLFFLEFIRN